MRVVSVEEATDCGKIVEVHWADLPNEVAKELERVRRLLDPDLEQELHVIVGWEIAFKIGLTESGNREPVKMVMLGPMS